jgi:hypothetical protein
MLCFLVHRDKPPTDNILNRPGAFIVAAYVLNDSVKTFMKNYAHLRTRMMNKHYPNYLDEIGPTLAKSRRRRKAPSNSISDLISDSEGLL